MIAANDRPTATRTSSIARAARPTPPKSLAKSAISVNPRILGTTGNITAASRALNFTASPRTGPHDRYRPQPGLAGTPAIEKLERLRLPCRLRKDCFLTVAANAPAPNLHGKCG